MQNEYLDRFLDELEILQGKRVKVLSAGAKSKQAIFWLKQQLGENLRSFEYFGRTKDFPSYAVFSFNEIHAFNELFQQAKKKGCIKLHDFR
jgi:hypothetical protein